MATAATVPFSSPPSSSPPSPRIPHRRASGGGGGPLGLTTWTCHIASCDRLEYLLIHSVALLTDVHLQTLTGGSATTGSATGIQVQCRRYHALTQTTTTATAHGWLGAVRFLAAQLPDLTLTFPQESWLESAHFTLFPIYQHYGYSSNKNSSSSANSSNDAVLEGAVLEYLNRLEKHLLYRHSTYLTGTHISLADVALVQLLAATLQSVGTLTVLPQQVHRWMTTVLAQLQECLPYATIPGGWRHFGLQRANIWDTWTHFLTHTCTVTESPLELPAATVAVVAAATTTATAPKSKTVTMAPSPAKTTTKEAVAPPAPAPAPATTQSKEATPSVTEVPSDGGSDDPDDATNPILQKLQASGLSYELYDHVRCVTAEELIANVPVNYDGGETHTKNLFLRDKKHGHFLVTLHAHNTTFSTKQLAQLLKLSGKSNLRLADEATLWEKLHVKPGCVGPLCMALADLSLPEKERVTLVLDQALLQCQIIHSHALRNNASVKLTPTDLQTFLTQHCQVTPVILDFGGGGGGSTTEAGGAEEASAVAAAPKEAPKPKPAMASKKSSVETTTSTATTTSSSNKKSAKKGETLLALQWKKSENFPSWYSDVIVLSEMISYYDISGCYILRPWSYKMWELIQYWFNEQIQALGVENAYFPLFVSRERLEKEKDHVEGFAPEVAWVTKSGSGDLAQPIAVRPTSETIMYPAYSDWIQSHRDLPLKLNQWSNVVRWEFKYPTPFLRTREFLWQEGHTAHASFDEAAEMVMQALELYRRVYEELLAVPVVPGYKTEKEKFAGGFRTTTVEAYIAGSGRAIQGATSHNLGQNFGKMFDITFQNVKGESEVAWQTSWGLTTRTIGVMVMVHGDDTGLVLPPRVAPLHVVIVPIVSKKFTREEAEPYCQAILKDLQANQLRAKYDDRSMYNPGWKYNHWEQKGVPIRIEVGPRDVEQKSARVVIRHNNEKQDLPVEGLGATLVQLLDTIQNDMFVKAKQARDSHIVQVTDWKDFVPNLEQNNLVLTPWCGGEYQEWEETVKNKSRQESLEARGQDVEDEKTSTSVAAKTLCIPFDQPELPAGTKCIISGMDATCWVLWGRSY
ncbi:hypothetical protein ACA910_008394 [Epithemia clementina (nom. ined.)]